MWWFRCWACACWRYFSGTVVEPLSVSEDISVNRHLQTYQELTQAKVGKEVEHVFKKDWHKLFFCKKEYTQGKKGNRRLEEEKLAKLLKTLGYVSQTAWRLADFR